MYLSQTQQYDSSIHSAARTHLNGGRHNHKEYITYQNRNKGAEKGADSDADDGGDDDLGNEDGDERVARDASGERPTFNPFLN